MAESKTPQPNKNLQLESVGDTKNLTSIVNFDLDQPDIKLEQVINSPRSLTAFRLTGVEPHELNPVDEKKIIK